jgi:hypothetical protein
MPAGIAGRWVWAAVEGRGAAPFCDTGKTAAQTWQRALIPVAGTLAGSTL